MTTITRFLVNDEATQALGQQLSECLSAPATVYLSGPLGAGKTSLVRALLRGFGVTGSIKSPTYSLVEPYKFSSYSIYHFDFYRFFDENEWEESGLRDYFEENAICLVEWPEKAMSVLPQADVTLTLSYHANLGEVDGLSSRQVVLAAESEHGERALNLLARKIQQ